MYICYDCGATFFDPDEDREQITSDPDAWDWVCKCPECGSDAFNDAKRCDLCGEWFPEEELIGGCCDGCLSEIESDANLLKRYVVAIDGGMEDFAEWFVKLQKKPDFLR